MKKRHKLLSFVISLMMVLSMVVSVPAPVFAAVEAVPAIAGLESFPDEVDPQTWVLPEEMTWDDWTPNPIIDWETDTTIKAGEDTHQKGLVLLVDYTDKPFVLTKSKGSDPMQNPIVDPVAEEDLAEFWENLLNEPSAMNHNTSINGFWRENSYGKWDVEVKAYGPYHLPGMEWEYGIDEFNGAPGAKLDIIEDTFKLALNSGDGINLNDYNFAFIIHAGYDESGVWQETGDMKFLTKDDITDEFGPSEDEINAIKAWGDQDPVMAEDWWGNEYKVNDIEWAKNLINGANWCESRYVPWSSWLAAKSVWSYTSAYEAEEDDNSGLKPGTWFNVSVQGESDGMATFAHEFGHIRDIGDNYNNPYGKPEARSYTGCWELMSRGSFAGPGGTHLRYQIPSLEGSSSPSEHMARLKLKQEFYDDDQYVRIKQADLYDGSIATADIVARAVPVGEKFGVEGYSSMLIDLEKDNTPIMQKEDPNFEWWKTATFGSMRNEKYKDKGYYQFYSIEVVDRIGYDSFASDAGVLLTMNREIDNESSPFMWIVDSHPEDINRVDFKKEDGTDAMVSKGDARQLADALFHAGTGEDVVNSYVDKYNNLKFYVLDKKYDNRGVLSYRIGVRSIAATGSAVTGRIPRSVKAGAGVTSKASEGRIAVQYVNVTNTSKATDIFAVTASAITARGSSWETQLQHEYVEVGAGKTVSIPVYVKVPDTNSVTFKFTATSESDSNKKSTVTIAGWHPVPNVSGNAITFSESDKVTISAQAANSGDRATIKATPAAGYQFKEWKANTAAVIFADKNAAQTTFIMPNDDITIEAVVEMIPVDRDGLKSLIDETNQTAANIKISKNGEDVSGGQKWTTQENMDAFKAAIAAAEAVYAKEIVKDEEILSAVNALTQANKTFNEQCKSGTKTTSFPDPIDPQTWKLPEHMTLDEWKPIPLIDWETDKTIEADEDTHQKGLLLLVDYTDRPFILTDEKGSDPLGNPTVDSIAEEDLAAFWDKLLNEPSELNNYTSVNGFWRENSYGKWDVEITPYGPYHLEGMQWEYGIDDMNGAYAAKRDIIAETFELALNSDDDIDLNDYNFAFIVHAGYEESGTWQETGDMRFLTADDITKEFGPSQDEIDAIKAWGAQDPVYVTDRNGNKHQLNDISWAEPILNGKNWCQTRYVPWTSWLSAKAVWSYTSSYKIQEGDVREDGALKPGQTFRVSVQGENDGMATFAHEFGHIRSIADNYNNPYGKPDGRTYTGVWELMSRGCFAGPEGTHERYGIPCLKGSAFPSEHMARLKLKQGFYDEGQYDRISQTDLYDGSVYTADVVAREIPVGPEFGVEGYSTVILDLEKDNTPIVKKTDPEFNWQTSTWGSMDRAPQYKDRGYYQFYSIEVVDRIGYDSFACDAGVLLAMNREIDNESAPWAWVIDSHPDDIDLYDFKKEDGNARDSKISLGDARQVADALFHAGTGEDVVNSYIDEYNNLKFYILDKMYDDRGVLSYRIGIISTVTKGSDVIARSVKAEAGDMSQAGPGEVAVQYVDVTNTSKATDIFKLTASVDPSWEVQLQNDYIEVAAGETVSVPVYVKVPLNNYNANTFTFTAASEADPNRTAASITVVGWDPVTDSIGHTITSPESNKVTVSVKADNAQVGNLVTITATPAAGYSFKEWKSDSASVIFADKTAAQTTFIMPDADVNIEAVLEMISVDRDVLKNLISEANQTTANIKISENGEDVLSSQKWTTQKNMDVMKAAIAAAEVVYAKETITNDEFVSATNTLRQAIDTFVGQCKPGTKASGGSSGGGGSSSSTVTYTVQFNSNGGSSVSSVKVEKNDTVSEPKSPSYKGYTFEGWYTDKALTKEFDFDTKITSNITLYAKWSKEEAKPVEPTNPTEPSNPTTPTAPTDKFTDVTNHWAAEAIRYVVEKGLMNGTGENSFAPDVYTNRAMLVTILHRLENYPSAGAHQFSDVSTSDWYSDAVAWASENGIVSGLNSSEFAPKNNITREQLVTILFRYAQFKGYTTNASADLSGYADNSQVSDWAKTAMEWAVGAGLMQGKTATELNPSGSATRAEIATILQRFIENIAK